MTLSCSKETLLRGITSTHQGDFYCQNCLHSFATEKKLESHKKVCENKDFCNVIMPYEDTKILEFNIEPSPSKKTCVIFLTESPLKVMKIAFYFILKALIVLKIFKFLSRLFGHVSKRLD